MKEISDALLAEERGKESNQGKPDDQLRNLCGMMRVGSLAAQVKFPSFLILKNSFKLECLTLYNSGQFKRRR